MFPELKPYLTAVVMPPALLLILIVLGSFFIRECEMLKLEILNYMGQAEKLTHAGKTLATWKCSKPTTRIATKALAQVHPEIASAFTTDVLGSRCFLLEDVS